MLNKNHNPRRNPLHTLFRVGTFAGWTDGELLEGFINGRGEVAERAFAVLVERHGAAVLRLCRGVLGDRDDADDALQATFLVLARRARSIRDREAVGRWLLSAAYRVAGCARTAGIRRRRHERRAAETTSTLVVDREPSDLGPLLREELGALPEKFQAPLVLCYLEGLSQDDVAVRLGWPIGTVRSRLARGRERLKQRLLLRGVSPAVAAVAVGITRDATALTVSDSLIQLTARSATRFAGGSAPTAEASTTVFNLAQEVLRTMIWTKFKMTTAVLLTGVVLVAGAGAAAGQAGKASDKKNFDRANATLRLAKETRAEGHQRMPGNLNAEAKEAQAKEAEPKEAQAKEAEPKEARAKEAQAKEAEAKEVQAKEAELKEAEALEAQAKEAKAKEAEAKEAEAKEAEAKEAKAREAEANEVEAKEAEAKEVEAKEAEVRLRQSEAAFEQAKANLEVARAATAQKRNQLEDRKAKREAGPTIENTRNSDQERRLRAIEEKLDRLLLEPTRARQANAYEERARIFPLDAEDRNKEAVWQELVRGGYIGRFDADRVAPDQLYTNLYRRFLGRRPTTEEMTPLLTSYGPGADQLRLDPETAVRRLLNCPAFWSSPLAQAIVDKAASPTRLRR